MPPLPNVEVKITEKEGVKILWPIPHILNNNLGVKPTENGAQGMTRYFSQYLMS